jgi:hypothetical protein
MMAFFYRNANATLDAVANSEGNEVIEEITGMSFSLESYLHLHKTHITPFCFLTHRLKSKNPGNRFEQKIRELIGRHLLVPLTDFLYTGVLSSSFHHCILLSAFYLFNNNYSLPYLLLNTCCSIFSKEECTCTPLLFQVLSCLDSH